MPRTLAQFALLILHLGVYVYKHGLAFYQPMFREISDDYKTKYRL